MQMLYTMRINTQINLGLWDGEVFVFAFNKYCSIQITSSALALFADKY